MTKISFVGDIMCEEQQLLANKTNNSFDFFDIFENIKPAFLESDFVVGNLETPLAGEDFKYTNHKWSFNSPVEFALAVKNAGFDLVATANNHCLDRGVKGLYNTIRNLNQINLDYTGTYLSEKESEKIYINKIGAIKIAFISYSYGTNALFNKFHLRRKERFAVNLFRRQEKAISRINIISRIVRRIEDTIINGYTLNSRLRHLKRKIKLAKRDADLVFVLMHSGGQYNLKPDNWTVSLMDYLMKNSVDAVIGCHPHVVQRMSIKGDNQIGAFSLGNFCSYPGSDSCKMNQSEYSIILHIYLNEISKSIEKVTFQISKSVIDSGGKAKIYLLYDLINNEKDEIIKKELTKDNLLIVNRFLNQQVENVHIENEYLLCNIK
ncbi:MAG: CapA family protein [Candidatus Gracilibacteria bacterium]